MTGRRTVRVTDAGVRWLEAVGHRPRCGCPEDHRIHRVLTLRPARAGGWLPDAGFRLGRLLAEPAEIRSLGDCAEAAAAGCPPAGVRALASMRDRCRDALGGGR